MSKQLVEKIKSEIVEKLQKIWKTKNLQQTLKFTKQLTNIVNNKLQAKPLPQIATILW